METARSNGASRAEKPKPRLVRTERRDGREPVGLGAALGMLVTEIARELPVAGALLRERWPDIARELAGHVTAGGFAPDTSQLAVCPEAKAWATKPRLEQTGIITAANTSAVRALRVLAPGTVPVPEPADAAPVPPTAAHDIGTPPRRAAAGPVGDLCATRGRTRRNRSAGVGNRQLRDQQADRLPALVPGKPDGRSSPSVR